MLNISFKSHLVRHLRMGRAFKDTHRARKHLRHSDVGTWALGGRPQVSQRVLGHSEGTWAFRGHLCTYRALGHLEHLGTRTFRVLRHLDTWALKALRHLSTQAVGHLAHLSTWALEHSRHSGTRALTYSRYFIQQTPSAVTAVEKKIPIVSNLVKKPDYNTKLMKLKRKFLIMIMANISLLQNLIS